MRAGTPDRQNAPSQATQLACYHRDSGAIARKLLPPVISPCTRHLEQSAPFVRGPKHPCTKMEFRNAGSIRSEVPGRPESWPRNRSRKRLSATPTRRSGTMHREWTERSTRLRTAPSCGAVDEPSLLVRDPARLVMACAAYETASGKAPSTLASLVRRACSTRFSNHDLAPGSAGMTHNSNFGRESPT